MLRCVVFDLESVLLDQPDELVTAVVQRCFSRYRLGAVSTSGDGNVAVKAQLESTRWGGHFDVVVTPSEVTERDVYRAACSAMGAQPTTAAFVTSRPDAAADAGRAGLVVIWVGADPPDGASAVEHLEWLPQALREASQ